MADGTLGGRRILLVEDEMLVAMLIEDMLSDLGCVVVGPISEVEEARAAVADKTLDAAILDLNLNGSPTFPVAEACRARGLPFLFATGYGADGVPEPFRGVSVLQKPFQDSDLARALTGLLQPA